MGKNMFMGQMLKMVSQALPDTVEPTNVVAVFVEEQIEAMFPDSEEVGLIKLLAVEFANKDPNIVLGKLVTLANAVSTFVAGLKEPETES